MPEKETIFSSKVEYGGIFSFKDFYRFCHDWLKDETKLDPIIEIKYEEKIEGASKKIEIKWKGKKKLTDYFRFDMDIEIKTRNMKEIEVAQGGAKIKTNQGSVEVKVKGILVRDYNGKFETTAFKKFLRGIYERWVIPASVEEYRETVAKYCDTFLGQAKAYLDLEGKK